MRFQGKIFDWDDDRGYGFVVPNGGGAKAFIHISALKGSHGRPANGVLVTYEVERDAKGRLRAVSVKRVADPRQASAEKTTLGAVALASMMFLVVAYVLFVRVSHPGSTVTASAYKIVFARDALRSNSDFQCRPEKSSCSKMTSCAEAFFHQEKCGVGGMDGDRNGIPCEQQWCR